MPYKKIHNISIYCESFIVIFYIMIKDVIIISEIFIKVMA